MQWEIPPRIKIYEALGCVADARIEIMGNRGKVFSSSHGKFYEVQFDPLTNAIMSNDNMSYWTPTLGYPAIAFLLKKGKLTYQSTLANSMIGIPWKDLNTQFTNDFRKTENHVLKHATEKGYSPDELEKEADAIIHQLTQMKLIQLGEKKTPPDGY